MNSGAKAQIGTVLDNKWRIVSLIGEGGMGAVFEAVHVRNSARVAVKLLHPDVARESTAKERFLQEGYAANKVNHKGVVRVLDDGVASDGAFYMVMELLEGRSIEQIAESRGGVLPADDVIRYTVALLDVMAKAHQAGVMHRDLKPENVFECKDGSIKVLDFGLARVREEANAKRLTTTGVPMGTPAFMAPEQALAHWDKVDARSDVFAIGATMFTLLTGQIVHPGSTVPELLVSACTKQVAPIRSLLPGLSEPFAYVIDRALAFAPEARWADGAAMLVGLREAISGHIAGRFALRESFDAAATTRMDPAKAPEKLALGKTTPIVAQTTAQPPRTTESPFSTGTGRSKSHRRTATSVLALGLALFIGAGALFFMIRNDATPPPVKSDRSTEAAPEPGSMAQPPEEPLSSPTVTPGPSASATESAAATATGTASATATAKVKATASPKATAKPRATSAPKPCKVDPFTERCAK